MDVTVIGAPLDLGADRRGVDMGPSAIRYANLHAALDRLGLDVEDLGNVAVPLAEAADTGSGNLKYLESIARVAETLADRVAGSVSDGRFPLILGGDHSLSLGSVTGVARHRSVGILWIDAHADFNTGQTSPSGNIHGMVLAALAGIGDPRLVDIGGFAPKVRPRNIAIVGARDIDPGEREALRAAAVTVFTMHEIDELGIPTVIERALAVAGDNVESVHLSLDLDVVDPREAPGVGTPVIGGLTYRETHLAMEQLAASGRISSMDVVEVNPILDERNHTARLAVEFILSALGKRIM